MLRLIILSLLATALVPIASADPVCVDTTCVNQYSYGDGCDSGSEWDDAGRGVTVSSGSTTAYVSNGCYVFNAEGYSEEGSYLQAGVYSCCDSGFQVVGFSWYGFVWNGNSECSIVVYSYGMDPVPPGALVDPIPCEEGPGVILP